MKIEKTHFLPFCNALKGHALRAHERLCHVDGVGRHVWSLSQDHPRRMARARYRAAAVNRE
jgi:hypothetical protein